MEGFTLLRSLREILNESVGSTFMNDRTSYDYIYHAVQDFNVRTHFATSNQTINVTANNAIYPLNADYCGIALANTYNQPYVKYTQGGSDTFIYNMDYSVIILNNSSATAPVAQGFAVTDAAPASMITGTATSTGTLVNGETTLTDTGASFMTTTVPGDYIHNTSDGLYSSGVVIAVVSNTQLICAMFEGTNNFYTSNDSYIIVPQSRYNIVLSPIPSATAILTVPYLTKPGPVYSMYRSYKLPNNSLLPIVHYAAFLYKFKDTQPDFGNALYKHYDLYARKVSAEMRKAIPEKSGFKVNMSKQNMRSTATGQWNG